MNGHWVQAPGDELFEALHKHFQPLPLVAEDLGLITPEVIALRKRHGFPGMKILQFAFDSDAHNPYLPHQHEENGVVYTGTHDNNTTIGWYKALPRKVKHRVMDYLSHPQEEMPWPLIRCALASVAQLAILPMQDVLALDGTHRMNTPGTVEGNWRWRFSWDQVTDDIAPRLHHLMNLYGR
jgi:4-alpha-glucanotransferase